MDAKGRNGTVTFDGSMVTITRSGLVARGTIGQGVKRIPLRSISAVQWKPASSLVYGFISFTIPGGNEVRSRNGRQTRDAAKDENSVTFKKSQMADMAALRDEVDRALASV